MEARHFIPSGGLLLSAYEVLRANPEYAGIIYPALFSAAVEALIGCFGALFFWFVALAASLIFAPQLRKILIQALPPMLFAVMSCWCFLDNGYSGSGR